MMAVGLQGPGRRGHRDGVSRGAARRYKGGRPSPNGLSMTKDELIIQLIKVALGILIGGYFLWWSLQVLERLPPPH